MSAAEEINFSDESEIDQDIDALVDIALRGCITEANKQAIEPVNQSLPRANAQSKDSIKKFEVNRLDDGFNDKPKYILYKDKGNDKGAKLTKEFIRTNNEMIAKPSTLLYSNDKTALSFRKKARVISGGSKSAGNGWFNMQGFEPTAELQTDIQLIKMRGYLDPKRFYKAPEIGTRGPGLAQLGTVIEGPSEYFSARLTKKQRKSSILHELLSDRSVVQYAKNKVKDIASTHKNFKGKKSKIQKRKNHRK